MESDVVNFTGTWLAPHILRLGYPEPRSGVKSWDISLTQTNLTCVCLLVHLASNLHNLVLVVTCAKDSRWDFGHCNISVVRKRRRTTISPATHAQRPVYYFKIWCIPRYTSIVNVVIFVAYSSQCATYFEKCGQRCVIYVSRSRIHIRLACHHLGSWKFSVLIKAMF